MPIVQTGRLGQSKPEEDSQKQAAVGRQQAVAVACAGNFEDRKAWAGSSSERADGRVH